jgi:hypothetical protein
MQKLMGRFGDIQEMAQKLPDQEQLTPEQLANPQQFMPNPNRIFNRKEDNEALKRYRAERNRLKKAKKKKR